MYSAPTPRLLSIEHFEHLERIEWLSLPGMASAVRAIGRRRVQRRRRRWWKPRQPNSARGSRHVLFRAGFVIFHDRLNHACLAQIIRFRPSTVWWPWATYCGARTLDPPSIRGSHSLLAFRHRSEVR